MHLTTQSHRLQTGEWEKSTAADLNKKILRNVEKGWFSRVEGRVRNWPFRSNCTFMFGRDRVDVGVVGAFLQYPHCSLKLFKQGRVFLTVACSIVLDEWYSCPLFQRSIFSTIKS